MRLTPLDIRQQQFRRVMRGLDPEEVEHFLSTVAAEFESLTATTNEQQQRIHELEQAIVEYKNMEKALRDALLAAERVMGEAKDGAHREAALIVREAEMAAERAKVRLGQDLTRIHEDIVEMRRLKDAYLSRVRWLLRTHLEIVDGHAQEFTELDAYLALPERPARTAPDPRAVPRAPESDPRPGSAPRRAPNALSTGSWQEAGAAPPPSGLDEVLRPVAPDGTYDRNYDVGASNAPALSAEEIAQAARRAEQLAAEARAALERHAGRSGRERGDRAPDEPGRRPV